MVLTRGMHAAGSSGIFLTSRVSLPQNIETAVCNDGINLQNFLYNLFWNTVAWYVVSTSQQHQLLTVYNLLGSSKYKQQTLLDDDPLMRV